MCSFHYLVDHSIVLVLSCCAHDFLINLEFPIKFRLLESILFTVKSTIRWQHFSDNKNRVLIRWTEFIPHTVFHLFPFFFTIYISHEFPLQSNAIAFVCLFPLRWQIDVRKDFGFSCYSDVAFTSWFFASQQTFSALFCSFCCFVCDGLHKSHNMQCTKLFYAVIIKFYRGCHKWQNHGCWLR